MLTVVDQLKAGRERIKRGWTQKTYARNAEGKSVGFRSPFAVEWCITASCDCQADPMKYLRSAVFSKYPAISIVAWNDRPERAQADILEAYDLAIELAEKELAEFKKER